MTTAYRDGLPGLPDSSPARLALLRSQVDRDFSRVEELWARRGDPRAERIEAARALWLRSRDELLISNGASSANHEQRTAIEDRFVATTLMLSGDLPLEERGQLLDEALAALPQGRPGESVVRATLASTAVRLGDLGRARASLAACDPASADVVADSAYRVARATLALVEEDFPGALHCLGRGHADVPIIPSYRRLAGVLRSHALERLGHTPEARRELARIVALAGARSAASIVDNLPASFRFDWTALEAPRRQSEALSAYFRFAAAVFVLASAIGAAVSGNPLASGDDAFQLACAPLLLGLAGYLVWRGRRDLFVAREGSFGVGTVVGKTRSAWRSGSARNPTYYLVVEAQIREQPVLAESLFSVPSSRVDSLLGRRVEIIWHPAHPKVALVDLSARDS